MDESQGTKEIITQWARQGGLATLKKHGTIFYKELVKKRWSKYTPRICSIKDCENKHSAKGLCAKHYVQQKKRKEVTS